MKKINKIAYLIGIIIVSGTLSASSDATRTVNRGTDLVEALGQLFWLAAFVIGVLFLIQGIRALVKYSNNPQQAEQQGGLLKPMLYTIGGAALAGFTAWTGFIQDFLLDGDETDQIDQFQR